MAAARKTTKRTAPPTTRAKNKGSKQRPVKASRPPATPTPAPARSAAPPGFLIVGIGASAGGLESMEEFFRHMPPSSGMAFVVVSHRHAGHVSLLPSLLGNYTAMPVMDAMDGMPVEPDHVYLAPGGAQLAILHGTLHFMEPASHERVPLPIDYFFRSLADDQHQRAVGIILSGTGTDGTVGLRAIKSNSGLTVAQDPQSAKYQGMPRSAITAGVVDVVMPAGQLWESLHSYGSGLAKPTQPHPDSDASRTLCKLSILLRERTGCDFALYKDSTIHRRIERRMRIHQIENMKQYLRFVLENPHELDALFHELLIGVTNFFRDPESFAALAQKGLPALVEGKPEGTALRVWVPACSTGEEAYSLAILLQEYLTQKKLRFTVQIFATDLDNRAIEQARIGLYPVGIAGDLTPARLQRFFTKEDSRYRIKKEIRDLVVFAVHNILTEAPFTKLDLVSCRNLLIYLDGAAQRKLLQLFHYALKPNGLLFLGLSETIGETQHVFTVLDRKQKLFKRMTEPVAFPRLERLPSGLAKAARAIHAEAEVPPLPARPASIPTLIQQVLVSRYVPASVVVNERGEVVYIHGETGAYLQPPPGPPTHRLVEMAREGLQHELATALHVASRKQDDIIHRGLRVRANGGHTLLVDMTVKRMTDSEALHGLFLVTFEQARAEQASARTAAAKKHDNSGLTEELEATKHRLKRTIEELQIANEELKSANEELQSTNEELQSTNEELETTKEELQSLNEELVTVNSELQGKLDALADAHDDLQNLLNSTEVATIFLDNELRIKRFTSEAKRISHLIDVDVGRPLSDIVSKLSYDQLVGDAQNVLLTLVVKEQEVQAADGSWFFMRVLPYRTAKNTIDGLVMTFLDITKLKEAERVITAARGLASSIVETVREPLLVLDDQLRVVSVNQTFYGTFKVTPREVEQQLLYHLCGGAWNIPQLRAVLEEVLPKRTMFQDFIMEQTFPQIGRKVFALNGRRLKQDVTQPGRILLAMEEVRGSEGKTTE